MPNRRVMYTWPLEGLSVVKGNFHAAFLGGWAAVTSLRLPGDLFNDDGVLMALQRTESMSLLNDLQSTDLGFYPHALLKEK